MRELVAILLTMLLFVVPMIIIIAKIIGTVTWEPVKERIDPTELLDAIAFGGLSKEDHEEAHRLLYEVEKYNGEIYKTR